MTKMRVVGAMAALVGLASANLQAQDEGPWSGKASLGYLSTTGNSETLNVSSAAEVGYVSGRWDHLAEVLAVGAQQDEVTTAEAYLAAWKTKYSFTENNYLFGRVRWQKDKFSGYDQQMSETVGYGRRILHSDRQTLNGEAGVGLRQSDLRDGTSENETILRGSVDYTLKLSENAEFSQDFLVESGSDNTFMESVSAVKASLIGQLALKASYTIRRNTSVPVGSEKTDTFTAISLEYEF